MASGQGSSRRLIDHVRLDVKATGEVLRVICTTHDLDAQFFDTDFLPTVLGVPNAEDRSFAARIALQQKLAGCEFSGVMVEASAYRRRPSLRTSVYPVSLHGVRLHAKLTVVEYEHAVRVVIGSANLTTPGYRQNREIAAEVLADDEGKGNPATVLELLEGALAHLANASAGAGELVSELSVVRDRVSGWTDAESRARETRAVWSSTAARLHDTFEAQWPSGALLSRVRVVSPFWAEDGSNDTPIRSFLGWFAKRSLLAPRVAVDLYFDATSLADGGYVPAYPAGFAVRYDDLPGVTVRAHAVDPKVDPEELDVKVELNTARRLHAKVLVAESSDGTALAYAGSANFTRAGWGYGRSANIEAGWLISTDAESAQGLIPSTVDSAQNVPSAKQLGPEEPEEDEAEAFWPSYVQSAILEPAKSDPERLALTVRWLADAPAFDVLVPADDDAQAPQIGTRGASDSFTSVLSPQILTVVLLNRCVVVREQETARSADYPVNIAAGEARLRLPIAPGEARPGESALLAYYQGRITFDDLYPDPESNDRRHYTVGPATLEDAGVDTSKIQAYQLRQFVDALGGLRSTLKELNGTRALLAQHFLGDVSPVGLARRIQEQVRDGARTPVAGAFQLVELARVLREAQTFEVTRESPSYAEFCQAALDRVLGILDGVRAAYPDLFSADGGFARYERALGARSSA